MKRLFLWIIGLVLVLGGLGLTGASFVQLRIAAPRPNEEELIGFTWEHLPCYACPERIAIVADLPRNATGKLDRERSTRQAPLPGPEPAAATRA